MTKAEKRKAAIEASGWKYAGEFNGREENCDDYVGPKGLEKYSLHVGKHFDSGEAEWMAVWDNVTCDQIICINVANTPAKIGGAAELCLALVRYSKAWARR